MRKIIDHCNTLGIIGLSKNTGKTTTLNKVIEIYSDITLGLTSIGLDGEDLDQVNFLPKPKIVVKPKMIVATAFSCLESSNVKYEVIEKTKMQTALGYVYIIRILSQGTMVIAGPTTNHDLHELLLLLKPYVDKIIVDGAFNRMTFASIDSLDAIVLATGAAYSSDMEKTIRQTKHVVESFNLSKSKDIEVVPLESLIVHTKTQHFSLMEKDINTFKVVTSQILDSISYIYIKGAVTEKMIDFFIQYELRDFTLICDDPTKLLFKDHYFDYIEKLGINMEVITKTPLLLVTINPWSPIGHHYDAKLFLESIEKVLNVPVFNVMNME
ncbi:MAG: hypothetical protein Q7I99_03710 [Acholeplasmataceae bacterium]|nr:hypothetical protein [Acholeplasmataceae bacterium]